MSGPLIEVGERSIRCLLCGRSFQAIGRHMQHKHGLPVSKSMTLPQRQALYGLPLGSRCALPSERERARVAIASNVAMRKNSGHGLELSTAERRSNRADQLVVAPSERMRDSARTAMSRAVPVGKIQCEQCLREFVALTKKRRFCTGACIARARYWRMARTA
jgi:hypothetical protein